MAATPRCSTHQSGFSERQTLHFTARWAMHTLRNKWRANLLVGFLVCALPVASIALGAEGPEPPENLRCEYLSNPMGIDVVRHARDVPAPRKIARVAKVRLHIKSS